MGLEIDDLFDGYGRGKISLLNFLDLNAAARCFEFCGHSETTSTKRLDFRPRRFAPARVLK